MEKKELQAKLDEVVKQIKTNSKDAHFAESLIDKALSLKGQMNVEPLELNIGTRLNEFKGETFEIVETTMGMWYHQFGGYNLFVKGGTNNALFETLKSILDMKDEYEGLDKELKEKYDLSISAINYCLTLPTFAFLDEGFTFEIATKIIEFIKAKYEDAMGKPLQEETPKENAEFEQAAKAVENIKEEAKKEE